MTAEQEDAFYEFLGRRVEPFTLKEITAVVRRKGGGRFRLSFEIEELIKNHRLAFELAPHKWLTRRGCFYDAKFVISPTRVEIANGILIFGHRCVPFANPLSMPADYKFFHGGIEIPKTDTEAAPEDIYPFYSIYGEEFAPQFVARENEKNEELYNVDPYEDPPEVSIKTLDMRQFYRASGFVPGDVLVARIADWENSHFEIERVPKGAWSENELNEWFLCAEDAFMRSFEKAGPEFSPEEQVAWAYFYAGERMKTVPAYSLEDFLYEKTDKIETVQFGIESRFWYAGKDIPDYNALKGIQTQSDQTPIEKMLFSCNVPVSEFAIQSYVRDAFYRKCENVPDIVFKIAPPSVKMTRWNVEILAAYIIETLNDFKQSYSIFLDRKSGPVRQRVAELHTAVIDLAARLESADIDPAWLPRHSFIILSQIQHHAVCILEELDIESDEELPQTELGAIENSVESMIETYEEIKETIEKSLDNYRRSNITIVKKDEEPDLLWRTIQIGIGGTSVWRRLVVPQNIKLQELHNLIQHLFNWTGRLPYKFYFEYSNGGEFMDGEDRIKVSTPLSLLSSKGFSEVVYEYGKYWTVKIIILAPYNAKAGEKITCIAGANAPPPEKLEGPLRFRRFISALDSTVEAERHKAASELGESFSPSYFNLTECNRRLG